MHRTFDRAAVVDSGLYHCRLQNDYGIAETEGQMEEVAGI